MSLYVLVFGLVVMLIMAYVLGGNDILSPFVIVSAMYCLSTAIAAVYMQKWQFTMSYFTVIIMLSALLMFGAGDIFARKVCQSVITKVEKKELQRIDIPIILTLGAILLFCLFLFIAVRETYEVSVQGGNNEGFSAMMTYARRMSLTEGYSRSRILNHALTFSKAASFIFGWAWIHNFVNKKLKKSDMLLLLPIVLAFLTQAIGTLTRGFAIDWVAYFFMLYFLKYAQKNNWKNINPMKIIFCGVAAIAMFLMLFVIMGLAASRFNTGSILDTIGFYLGLSVPSFDSFVKRYDPSIQNVGSETLYGVYALLNKMGLCEVDITRHLEFVDFHNVSGNVYTSLRRYINDYGYVGLYIIQFYVGAFYSFVYNLIRRRSNEAVIICYSAVAYSLVMQGIDELIISNYVSLSTVYLFGYMLIAYLGLVKLPQMLKRLKRLIRVNRTVISGGDIC